jgi:hypothetical protein
VRLNGKARGTRIERGVGLDLGGVEVQVPPPDQTCLNALRDDRLEEATEDGQPIALPNAAQTGVVGQRFPETLAEIPAQTEPVGDHTQQLAL